MDALVRALRPEIRQGLHSRDGRRRASAALRGQQSLRGPRSLRHGRAGRRDPRPNARRSQRHRQRGDADPGADVRYVGREVRRGRGDDRARSHRAQGRARRRRAMSMICNVRRAAATEIDVLLKTPAHITTFLYGDAATPPRGILSRLFGAAPPPPVTWAPRRDGDEIDIEKAWHGLHFMFTGTAWDGTLPAAFLLTGGRE